MGEEIRTDYKFQTQLTISKQASIIISSSLSVSVIMSEVKQLLEDSKCLTDFISDPASDLTVLENSNLAILKLLQIVINNQDSDRVTAISEKVDQISEKVSDNEERILELEEDLSVKEKHINELNERLIKSEQYSRRNTAIVTGVPYQKNENLEAKICDVINSTNILHHEFQTGDIAHVHRNKWGTYSSITLQFVRGIDKDRLFSAKPKFRLAHLKPKINIHHAMCDQLIEEKKEIETVQGVKWVDFRGHAKMFVVKMDDENFFRGIRGCSDLINAINAPPSAPFSPRVEQLMMSKPLLNTDSETLATNTTPTATPPALDPALAPDDAPLPAPQLTSQWKPY